MRPERWCVAAGLIAAVLAAAEPAAADPPQPTDYRAVIDEVSPQVDGMAVEVIGGDAFLEVIVGPGHEVTVLGYGGEPYLRILDDGSVQENQRSPATYLNASRDGRVDLPPDVDNEPDAPPVWETVADNGRRAWHDHRIHWMAPTPPQNVGPDGVVQDWRVELEADGQPVTISGRLLRAGGVHPLPWAALAALVLLSALVLGGLSPRWLAGKGERLAGRPLTLVASRSAALAAGVAVIVAYQQWVLVPAGAGGRTLPLLVPVIGLAVSVLGLILAMWRSSVASIATLAATAAVMGWALLRLEVFWKAVLPTELPASLDRAGTAVALGLAAAAALVQVSAGVSISRATSHHASSRV